MLLTTGPWVPVSELSPRTASPTDVCGRAVLQVIAVCVSLKGDTCYLPEGRYLLLAGTNSSLFFIIVDYQHLELKVAEKVNNKNARPSR